MRFKKIIFLFAVLMPVYAQAFDLMTTDLISDNAITSAKVQDGAIIADDISDNSITGAKLSDNSIDSSKIQLGAFVLTVDSLANGQLVNTGDDQTFTMGGIAAGDVAVYINGVFQSSNFFTYDGNVTVVLQDAIEAGDSVSVFYTPQ